MRCYVCWNEFKGWCKSFTCIEVALSALQAFLLFILIGFLTFITLHLLVCPEELGNKGQGTRASEKTTPIPFKTSVTPSTITFLKSKITVPPDVECTWKPSMKTKQTTHYYWTFRTTYELDTVSFQSSTPNLATTDVFVESDEEYNDEEAEASSDGIDASKRYKEYVAALVKLKPPTEMTFGCILTKVTRYWTLTAASCIEAIEEMDSLDSFFIMESYGDSVKGVSHALVDVQIHPLYQGANRSYDLAALRSEDALAPVGAQLLKLPTMLEYMIVAVGERFTILGYGGYRTIDKSSSGRRLRRAATYIVSTAQCGGAADVWAPRHLARGGGLRAGPCGAGAGPCGAAALCAGAVRGRARPCAWCAGAPLSRAGRLYGVMADNPQCGVACEPTLYVNVAALRDWILSVIDYDQ